jgi:hypothetical protein
MTSFLSGTRNLFRGKYDQRLHLYLMCLLQCSLSPTTVKTLVLRNRLGTASCAFSLPNRQSLLPIPTNFVIVTVRLYKSMF